MICICHLIPHERGIRLLLRCRVYSKEMHTEKRPTIIFSLNTEHVNFTLVASIIPSMIKTCETRSAWPRLVDMLSYYWPFHRESLHLNRTILGDTTLICLKIIYKWLETFSSGCSFLSPLKQNVSL